jgi:hypothetical protein
MTSPVAEVAALASWHVEQALEAMRLVDVARAPWTLLHHKQRAEHHKAAAQMLTTLALRLASELPVSEPRLVLLDWSEVRDVVHYARILAPSSEEA